LSGTRQERSAASTTATVAPAKAQGPWQDLQLHTLGWKSFQDLCAHICTDLLNRPVEVYREAADGGQDAVFLTTGEVSETGTVQCKFTSKSDNSLQLGDLSREEETIADLVGKGLAQTYVFMTNMSVGAPKAVALKNRLRELGVLKPHVFGKQFLVQTIQRSPRLRALVPRVYGIGDLSLIMDERSAEQTKAMLGHMLPALRVYVTTRAHVHAVRSLSEHKIALLLGDPASGKSTIAAILATTIAERASHMCYKLDGPDQLIERWNPNERGGFYWIDDAFGPNQMREDYVDVWIGLMPKIQAAIAQGNQFVLTSRRHIYEAAKPKLGTRNLQVFRDGTALVNVGDTSEIERRQILYNHIKAGNQLPSWKKAVKPHLETITKQGSFLPEIARRLADPAYTKKLKIREKDLLDFVQKPTAAGG